MDVFQGNLPRLEDSAHENGTVQRSMPTGKLENWTRPAVLLLSRIGGGWLESGFGDDISEKRHRLISKIFTREIF